MIYVFYSNDPLGSDQGGGVAHLKGIYRALSATTLKYRFVVSRNSTESLDTDTLEYISSGAHFCLYYVRLWMWFFVNRNRFTPDDVFHFHRNYVAWPKYVFAGSVGRTIITYHGVTGNVLRQKIGVFTSPVRAVMRYLEARALNRSDQIIFVSDRDRQGMVGNLLGGNYQKTCVIPASFNADAFARSAPPTPALANEVVIIGRLSDIKNIPLAIDAVGQARLTNDGMRLTIVGEGEDRARIENHVQARGAGEWVSLRGKVPPAQIPMVMREHGIVLLSSWSEASPTVVKEAIAAQRPVVTTDVGDVKLWVQEGRNGFVCGMNAQALADGLKQASALVAQQRYQQAVDIAAFSEATLMGQLLTCYNAAPTQEATHA